MLSGMAFESPRPSYPSSLVAAITAQASEIAATATRRMEGNLPWVAALTAEERSWLGVVAQEAIRRFVAWVADPSVESTNSTEIFNAAPRALARSVSLHQTVALIRLLVAQLEADADSLVGTEQAPLLREAALIYSREVAFSAAEVYANAAESRGAWDARLESFAIDALVRGAPEATLRSRMSTLGWNGAEKVCAVVGRAPQTQAGEFTEELRAAARHHTSDVVIGLQGDTVIAAVGFGSAPTEIARALADRFESGPVVIGPEVDGIAAASESVRAALAGIGAVAAWPHAPNPVLANELLPERVLAGDDLAREVLLTTIYEPLAAGSTSMIETLEHYVEQGNSLEAASRGLYVHPNTVRYRLRRITQIVGWDPTDAREGYVLRTALALGRLREAGRAMRTERPTP